MVAAAMANAAPDMNALVSASRSWVRRSLTRQATAAWTLAALGGCLAELSGAGPAPALTLAFGLVREAQRRGEPAAWISRTESTFFPPDVAEGGIDLAALPVILLGDVRHRLRAADRLARSGAFGLLVVDLGARLDLPLAVQTRLAEQALAHGTLILCLTEKTERQPSLGSLVAIRGQARCIRYGPDRFACRVHALKDKRRGPGWTDQEWCRGPDGMR